MITPYVGGGFGGKSAHRQAVEAARLAQATGEPVQVAWTREEEFFYDTFDPAAVVKITLGARRRGPHHALGLRRLGRRRRAAPTSSTTSRTSASAPPAAGRGAREQRVAERLHRFAVGPWRAPGANMNVFAAESQIDIMAAAAGLDPLELRLRNLTDQRMRRVLEAAAEAFGWQPGRAARADAAGAWPAASTPAPTSP